MAHVGLNDLLEEILDETLPLLAAPRRRAIEIVTLRAETSADGLDERALAVAVRDVLELLSERATVVVAIDDVQWLDSSSSSALAFALRRLEQSDVRLLLARRHVGDAQAQGIEHEIRPEAVQSLTLGPISVGALHQLLRDRLGKPFARQTLLRIHARAGGNPLFALELARVIDTDGDPLKPLPVPPTLDALLRAKIADLPGPTRHALELVSAMGTPSDSLLARLDVDANALEPAFAARLIEREAGAIRFTHPLLSSVLYQELGKRREALHSSLAQTADDPLVRARHLALSRQEPDAGVASVLDQAVTAATNHGAAAVAAELAEHAVRLTPPDAIDERQRRMLSAARAHQAAGEWTRARKIASDLLVEVDVGWRRAEALVFLSELDSLDRAAELLTEALTAAVSEPALQARIHCRLAWVKRFRGGSAHARAALSLAEELQDEDLLVRSRAVQAILGWFSGDRPAPSDLATLGQHLPAAIGGQRLVQEATQAIVNTFAPVSKREEIRALLEGEQDQWRDLDEPRSARASWGLAWLEFFAGRWPVAAEHAARAHDIAIQYGLEVPQDHLPIAVIAAHQGKLELAREHSERALQLADAHFGFQPPQHMAVMGLIELWSGDSASALEWFEKADRRATALQWGEPSVRWWTADLVELLLEEGHIDLAVRLVDRWEADAARVGRDWVLAHVTGCRGLISAAVGQVEQAQALLTRAVAQHDAVGDPFGRARALLALGIVKRRARQKRPARECIEAAADAFEAIGASAYAARARAELGGISGRRQTEGLTAAERRVAALVAEGRTNREVASTLFLAERSVASHLTHIYAKLGVRSRAQLARLLTDESA
jgi:DNA-binding CsgD family transcriptional regulator